MNEFRARAYLLAICIALGAGTVAYRLLVFGHLEQTAALFIGLPLIIALSIILCVPRPLTLTGMVTAIIALALAMGGMLWGEGMICILMMSPLFFLVGIAVALPIDLANQRKKRSQGFPVLPPTDKPDRRLAIALLFITPLTLEGTTSWLSFPQQEVVIATEVVPGTPADIEAALSRTPRFSTPLPLYFRLGFPQPVETSGAGLAVGDQRRIHFANGEGAPGDLLLQIAEHQPGHLRFQFLSDSSHVAHWLAWQSSDVQWSPVDARHTRVTWTLGYRRLLHPAWYFKPWERYAVGLTAHYLIQNLATPGTTQ